MLSLQKTIEKLLSLMQFYSTNHISPKVSLREAVMTGIAADGGLFLPEQIPVIPKAFFKNIAEMSIREIAYVVADLMLRPDIDSATIKRIVYDTFTFDIPLTELTPSIYALELFHGPTLAFKDVGARFLARIISHFNDSASERGRMKVVVATSGDSGGAVASGFFGVPGVDVYVLYPHGRLSAVQRNQFLQLGGNVHAIEVNGTFDMCQRLAREALSDPELRHSCRITTANSLNICRLLPQTFYFFYAYAELLARRGPSDVVIAVPCGNLGNLSAALIAMKMGLPVKRLIAATNANTEVLDFLRTGIFETFTPVRTVASAMDVATPANMPRVTALCDGRFDLLSELVAGAAASDDDIKTSMRELFTDYRYLCDPHGATAYHALKEKLRNGETGIFLSTAHPSKFPDILMDATGVRLPSRHDGHRNAKLPQPARIPPSLAALRKILTAET